MASADDQRLRRRRTPGDDDELAQEGALSPGRRSPMMSRDGAGRLPPRWPGKRTLTEQLPTARHPPGPAVTMFEWSVLIAGVEHTIDLYPLGEDDLRPVGCRTDV